MANVLNNEKRQQILALGQLGWSLRRIQAATHVRRETISTYLKAAGVGVWPPGGWGTANRFKTGHWGDHRLWRGVEHSATREPGPGAWGFGKTGHLSKGLHRIERSPYRGADRSRLPGARLRFTNRGPFWRRRGCLNRKIHRRQLCPKLCPLLATTVPHH